MRGAMSRLSAAVAVAVTQGEGRDRLVRYGSNGYKFLALRHMQLVQAVAVLLPVAVQLLEH